MPDAAPRPCTYPGCGRLVRGVTARCPLHPYPKVRRKPVHGLDGARRSPYDSAAWKRARAAWLFDNPLCVGCIARGDRRRPATEVDHVKPHRGDSTLFWSRSNWQSLCASCHASKTAREDGGFGNRSRHDAPSTDGPA